MQSGFEKFARQSKRELFLEEMDKFVPWARLVAPIGSHYPTGEQGRPAVGLERMLRLYFLQQWFNLSDPGLEDTLYESPVLRLFAGIDLGREPVPDETTILNFRHLLEKHDLGRAMLNVVNEYLAQCGVQISTGTIVDATIIHAPSSTKNREGKRDPEMHQVKKGNQWYFGMKAHVGVDRRKASCIRRKLRQLTSPTRRCCRSYSTAANTRYRATPPIRGRARRFAPWLPAPRI
jgi:transposase, IS5 family